MGEFCRPGTKFIAHPKPVQKAVVAKRAESSSQEESAPKKKKAKKA